jgi:cytochrome c oxidase subunit 1
MDHAPASDPSVALGSAVGPVATGAATSYLNDGTTVASWLDTRAHKRVGLMFLVAVLGALFLGGVFAMAIRIELLTPEKTIVDATAYNRLFTLHGVVMIFLFLVPAIPSAFGNFMVPLMIGARDVAFPRINLLSFYLYLTGSALVLSAMVRGGTDTGWTFYTPYSTTTATAVVPVLIGVFVVGCSSIASGINFIVTVHTMRAPGLAWMRLPLFVWSIYGASIIQVIATPVLGLTVLLVAIEHTFHIGLFDPAVGGDPVLMQHLFWFYSHPAVYITILPAMGVISEVVSGLSRKNSFGYRAIVYSTLGIAFVGFFTWGHHLFVSGQSTFDAGFFGVASMLVGIFTAIKVFTWIGTMYKGAIAFTTPYAYVCGFIFFLVFGGMTGIALATVSLDAHWHDTYFVVAHFHFVMVGAALMAFLAGLHYWFPKIFGKAYNEAWGLVSTALIILGFNATFIPQFLLGNAGMPRRYYSYPAEFQALNVASTAGATLLGFGFLIIAVYLAVALARGRRVTDNPWESRGFEWHTASPPVTANFVHAPAFSHAAHDYQTGHPDGR